MIGLHNESHWFLTLDDAMLGTRSLQSGYRLTQTQLRKLLMEISLPSFGKRLKRLRRIKGLKQEVIASLAQVNQATVSRWECGTVVPDQETMQFVFGALNQMPFLDSALQRLVHTSSLQVHLITDVDPYADTERSSVLLSCSA